jgi:glycine hydroxymethyltransferase
MWLSAGSGLSLVHGFSFKGTVVSRFPSQRRRRDGTRHDHTAYKSTECPTYFVPPVGSASLQDADPEIFDLISMEALRQRKQMNLIASENYASPAVLEALGSCLVNKYSEGYPGKRYYAGNSNIDAVELLCQKRALSLFKLNSSEWSVNVQPYSGSPANFAVYTALLNPGDTILGLSLDCGGHLSHGHQTTARKVSATAKYFNCISYGLDAITELVNYEQIEALAIEHKPKLIIAGASAYSRDWDYRRIRLIADKVKAYSMADIAHTAGFVATGLLADPFKSCDVVTCTTQKSLRGPRAGVIFCKKEYVRAINDAVFPGLQGGPHNNQVAGVAVALHEASLPTFKTYAERVIQNARTLSDNFIDLGYKILTNGTDNHMMLISLRQYNVTGKIVEELMESCGILVNRNAVVGDNSALQPSGIRIGTLAVTTMGLGVNDMKQLALLIHQVVMLARSAGDARGIAADKLETIRDHVMLLTKNNTLYID